MARPHGRAPRCVDRPETAPDDDASAWAQFLRRLTDTADQDAEAQTEGSWARFLRRLALVRERPDDTRSDDS